MSQLLASISSPADLNSLTSSQLRQLAAESPYAVEPLLEDGDWSALQASCDRS